MFRCSQTGVSSQMEQLLLSEERTTQLHELRKLMQKHELESCGRFLNVDDKGSNQQQTRKLSDLSKELKGAIYAF